MATITENHPTCSDWITIIKLTTNPFLTRRFSMSKTTQKSILDPSETAQVLELQGLLKQAGMDRSISQLVDYALRVALTNAKAPPNEDFRDTGGLFSDPFERTI